jgi:hypothetical protein
VGTGHGKRILANFLGLVTGRGERVTLSEAKGP